MSKRKDKKDRKRKRRQEDSLEKAQTRFTTAEQECQAAHLLLACDTPDESIAVRAKAAAQAFESAHAQLRRRQGMSPLEIDLDLDLAYFTMGLSDDDELDDDDEYGEDDEFADDEYGEDDEDEWDEDDDEEDRLDLAEEAAEEAEEAWLNAEQQLRYADTPGESLVLDARGAFDAYEAAEWALDEMIGGSAYAEASQREREALRELDDDDVEDVDEVLARIRRASEDADRALDDQVAVRYSTPDGEFELTFGELGSEAELAGFGHDGATVGRRARPGAGARRQNIRMLKPERPPNFDAILHVCLETEAESTLDSELESAREALQELVDMGMMSRKRMDEHLRDIVEDTESHGALAARRDAAQLALRTLTETMHITQSLACPHRIPSHREAGEIALRTALPNASMPLYLDISDEGTQPVMIGGLSDPEELDSWQDADGDPAMIVLAGALIWTGPGRRVILPFGSVGDESLDIEVLLPVLFGEAHHPGAEVTPTSATPILLEPDFALEPGADWLARQSVILARVTLGLVESVSRAGVWKQALAHERSR